MITKQEKSIITNLLRDPGSRIIWDTLQKIGQDRIDTLRKKKPSLDSQWKMTKSTLMAEGEIDGIKGFFNEIENYVK
uniref:Uncharacterized protein n=1 Tax=viral metagenome TaxID=1070528 RepID=A0A6H1ZGQ5_9ZZZZ